MAPAAGRARREAPCPAPARVSSRSRAAPSRARASAACAPRRPGRAAWRPRRGAGIRVARRDPRSVAARRKRRSVVRIAADHRDVGQGLLAVYVVLPGLMRQVLNRVGVLLDLLLRGLEVADRVHGPVTGVGDPLRIDLAATATAGPGGLDLDHLSL